MSYDAITWSIICVECSHRFQWVSSQSSDVPPAYCSKTCKARRARHVKDRMPVKCPRLDKKLYTHRPDADKDAIKVFRATGRPANVYHCKCGGFHVGTLKAKIVSYAEAV